MGSYVTVGCGLDVGDDGDDGAGARVVGTIDDVGRGGMVGLGVGGTVSVGANVTVG